MTVRRTIMTKTLKEYIIDKVNNTLRQCNGNQSLAARKLNITRSTLRKYMDNDYAKFLKVCLKAGAILPPFITGSVFYTMTVTDDEGETK